MPTTSARTADGHDNAFVRLQLRNFRAFAAQTIDLAPITIFVGPNNSGKSSVLSSLRILSQTLQSLDPEVPLLLGEFGTFKDVVYGNIPTRTFGIRLGMMFDGHHRSFDANFQYRAQRREIVQQNFVAYDEEQPVIRTAYSRTAERQKVQEVVGAGEIASQMKVRFFHFLPRLANLAFDIRSREAGRTSFSVIAALRDIDKFIVEITRKLSRLQYLGPFRDAPQRAYPFSGERPSIVGAGGKGATDILVADYFTRGSRKRVLSNSVQAWLARAKMASALEVHALSERQYDIKFQHPVTGEIENLADVGFGLSQVLPVLVAGYNLQPGSVFMIEQPEIHLHPRAQSELGEFFYNLYSRGVQSLVETHSEHLILRLQRYVGEGLIRPEHIAVNFVHASEGVKTVARLPLSVDGIFTQPWPEGFFEERLDEALGLARAPLVRKGEIV